MKAVLFDMDGILIDTEKYLTVYKQKAMREAGYRLDLKRHTNSAAVHPYLQESR